MPNTPIIDRFIASNARDYKSISDFVDNLPTEDIGDALLEILSLGPTAMDIIRQRLADQDATTAKATTTPSVAPVGVSKTPINDRMVREQIDKGVSIREYIRSLPFGASLSALAELNSLSTEEKADYDRRLSQSYGLVAGAPMTKLALDSLGVPAAMQSSRPWISTGDFNKDYKMVQQTYAAAPVGA